MYPRFLHRVTILAALLLVAMPAWGYVVILKDGTQIITREKYRREGDRVYLILQNGTETFITASEIDFAKTDELNVENIGQVRVIEQGTRTGKEKPLATSTSSTPVSVSSGGAVVSSPQAAMAITRNRQARSRQTMLFEREQRWLGRDAILRSRRPASDSRKRS